MAIDDGNHRHHARYCPFYAVGWTVSGVATLATIVAVWMFGI
ncbi:hypothetical protein [Bradyrhizobium sp. th.b2]|nr:hypothetical protein [Bradyrhizobium sp. th.b2]